MLTPHSAEEEKSIETFDAALASVGMHAKYRSDCPEVWRTVSSQVDYLPVTYSEASIDYQITYWRGMGRHVSDTSLVLFHDNRPFGVWPLSVTNHEVMSLGSGGDSLLPPIFDKLLAPKSKKSLTGACLDLADEFCRIGSLSAWESRESFSDKQGLSQWHEQSMQRGAKVALGHDIFVDLSPDMSGIKSGLRKSYKALITSGRKLGQVGVLNGEGPEIWGEFRQLHRVAAGRVTRSDESWQLQYSALLSGNAFLVYLRDHSGRMVGAALFNTTHDEGYYSVGAYDRALFDKPLGHVIQYQAIEEMKRLGLRWYFIGARPYPGDQPPPTEKQIAIVSFQEGFASHHFPRFLINRKIAQRE